MLERQRPPHTCGPSLRNASRPRYATGARSETQERLFIQPVMYSSCVRRRWSCREFRTAFPLRACGVGSSVSLGHIVEELKCVGKPTRCRTGNQADSGRPRPEHFPKWNSFGRHCFSTCQGRAETANRSRFSRPWRNRGRPCNRMPPFQISGDILAARALPHFAPGPCTTRHLSSYSRSDSPIEFRMAITAFKPIAHGRFCNSAAHRPCPPP